MPRTARATARHADDLDVAVSLVECLADAVDRSLADGRITHDEAEDICQRIDELALALRRSRAEASLIDSMTGVIGALLHTMEHTDWTDERLRESRADQARLRAQFEVGAKRGGGSRSAGEAPCQDLARMLAV